MDQQHSSKRTSVSPRHLERASPDPQKTGNERSGHYSTPVNRDRIINYTTHTPTKLHDHPPGWERITWAPKVCSF